MNSNRLPRKTGKVAAKQFQNRYDHPNHKPIGTDSGTVLEPARQRKEITMSKITVGDLVKKHGSSNGRRRASFILG
jgi:hypothetical protein